MWRDFLASYAAGVDVPVATCWRELAAAFPDAPVLLSSRSSAEVWHRSMAATVLPRTRQVLLRDDSDPAVPLFRAIFSGVLSDLDDPRHLMAAHDRWNADVRAEVAPGRLVEWQPGDGWEPLCEALDVTVPDLPFPHENSTADYLVRAELRAREGRARGALSPPGTASRWW